jgi:hypothetical protein
MAILGRAYRPASLRASMYPLISRVRYFVDIIVYAGSTSICRTGPHRQGSMMATYDSIRDPGVATAILK